MVTLRQSVRIRRFLKIRQWESRAFYKFRLKVLIMGNVSEKVDAASVPQKEVTSEAPKKLKPCCACPETKKVRDQCIIEKGEENCGELIEAHKKCMRDLGFNI